MAYTYSNWNDDTVYATTPEKLAALRRFQGEVLDNITAAVSRDGASRDSTQLQTLYDTLLSAEQGLMRRPDAVAGGVVSRVRLPR